MQGQDNAQLELFSESREGLSSGNEAARNSFLVHIWNYEKIILTIIGIVITSIVSFSLGVEKGKRMSAVKNNFYLDIALKKKELAPVSALKKEEITKNEGAIKIPILAQKQTYTIQLASYKTRAYADKEIQALKKRGLSPLLVNKGRYVVLYVGNFANKETAQPLLVELKKCYKGCYVRRQ